MQTPRDPKVPTVLIVHGEEWAARSLESVIVQAGLNVIHAASGADALRVAAEHQPDAVLLHSQLPDVGGVELCRELRAATICRSSVPIILTSSEGVGRTQMRHALAAGAWDLYGLPVDSEIFLQKLRIFMQANAVADSAHATSLVDARTGFYNARGFARRAAEVTAEARRRKAPVTCVIVEAHDRATPSFDIPTATERLAVALRHTGRTSDPISMLSDGSFALLAVSHSRDWAQRLFRRLQNDLAGSAPGEGPRVRVRAGVSTRHIAGTVDADVEELVREARVALSRLQRQERYGALATYDAETDAAMN